MKICLRCKLPRTGLNCSTCDQALEPIDKLIDYELLDPIGKGGQGHVFSCITNGQRRAIKFIDPTQLRDPKARAQAEKWFTTEVTALERIKHPHVIALHEHGPAGPLMFVVTNFVRRTLRGVLEDGPGPLALPRAVGYAAQLADALTYLHDHGIQHRDIKPKNIGVTKHHQIKLFDFGAAGLNSEARQTTVLGGAYSEPYAAPEQLRGEETTYQTDIYSFGAVLFEMLTGKSHRPQVRTRFKSMEAFYTQRMPAMTRDLPPRLEDLIHRCLHPDPHQRVQHTWHLQAVLAELADRLDGGFVQTWQAWREMDQHVPRLRAEQTRLQAQVDTLSATLSERSQALAQTEAQIQDAARRAADAQAEAKGFETAARRARSGFDAADGQLRVKQAEAEDAEARAVAAQQRAAEAEAATQQACARTATARDERRAAEQARMTALRETQIEKARLDELRQHSTVAAQGLITARTEREAAKAEAEALATARSMGQRRRLAMAAALLAVGLGVGYSARGLVDEGGGDKSPSTVPSVPGQPARSVIVNARTIDRNGQPIEMVRFYINGKKFGITDEDGVFHERFPAREGDRLRFNVEAPFGYQVPPDIDQSRWQYEVHYPADGRSVQIDFTATLTQASQAAESVASTAPKRIKVQAPEGEGASTLTVEKLSDGWRTIEEVTFKSLAAGEDDDPWMLPAGTRLRSCNGGALQAPDALKQCAANSRKDSKTGFGTLKIELTTPEGDAQTITVKAY